MNEQAPKTQTVESLADQALKELTPEQLEAIEEILPDGPLNEEDRLLLNRLALEAATGTSNSSFREVIKKFKEERAKILNQGGYTDPEDYIVEKGGTVIH